MGITLRERNCQFNVLVPIDGVRNRLASLMICRDRSYLQQALSATNEQWDSMDHDAIERWCRWEGK